MHFLNIYYPRSEHVLAGICDFVELQSQPEKVKGHYLVRSVKPFSKILFSKEQLHAVKYHIMLGHFFPQNRPKFGRILGIVEVDDCSPSYRKQFFKLKIKRVYRLREPLTVEEYVRLFGDGFPTRGYIEEIPLQK